MKTQKFVNFAIFIAFSLNAAWAEEALPAVPEVSPAPAAAPAIPEIPGASAAPVAAPLTPADVDWSFSVVSQWAFEVTGAFLTEQFETDYWGENKLDDVGGGGHITVGHHWMFQRGQGALTEDILGLGLFLDQDLAYVSAETRDYQCLNAQGSNCLAKFVTERDEKAEKSFLGYSGLGAYVVAPWSQWIFGKRFQNKLNTYGRLSVGASYMTEKDTDVELSLQVTSGIEFIFAEHYAIHLASSFMKRDLLYYEDFKETKNQTLHGPEVGFYMMSELGFAFIL